MISSVVASASALVSAAFPGRSAIGANSQYAPLLLTGTYQAQMYAILSRQVTTALLSSSLFFSGRMPKPFQCAIVLRWVCAECVFLATGFPILKRMTCPNHSVKDIQPYIHYDIQQQ
jgi:hypothetical protein